MKKDIISEVIRGCTSGKQFSNMTDSERTIFAELVKAGVLCDGRSSLKVGIDDDRSELLVLEQEVVWSVNKEKLKKLYGL